MRELVLNLGTFTHPVVLDVARRDGSLAAAGLTVHETQVVSSPAQFTSLEAGEYDLVFTSPDNVIAYRFVADNPLGRILPVEIIWGVDRGLGLSLCLAPGVTSPELVRGKAVGVDVPQSGFAFVAYELLRRAGLSREDYTLSTLGSTPRRAAALAAGECAATVLNAGNELRAAGAGCTIHSSVSDIGPYLGTVIARMATDDPARHDAHRRFTDVIDETVRHIVAGEREDLVVQSARELLDLDEREARAHYRCLLDPANGFLPSGRIDRASVATLLELRRRFLPAADLDHVEQELERFIAPDILD